MYNTLAKFGENLSIRLISILKLPWSKTPVKMSSLSDDQKKSRPIRLHFPVGRPRTIQLTQTIAAKTFENRNDFIAKSED